LFCCYKNGGVTIKTATVRIPEDKRDVLKIIACIEKREIKEILSELIDTYTEQHRQTIELLSRPEWVDIINKGKAEVEKGIKGSPWYITKASSDRTPCAVTAR